MEHSEILLDERYRRSEAIISRQIAGEAVLVPLRQNTADLEAIYAVNEVAALMWEMMDGTHTLREALERVTAEFEVEEEEAGKDLVELVTQLRELGALERV